MYCVYPGIFEGMEFRQGIIGLHQLVLDYFIFCLQRFVYSN